MKNPVTWIDEKLLAATRLVAKRYNWLTGKDNFHLARILAASGSIALTFAAWQEGSGIFSALLVLAFVGGMSFVLISIFQLSWEESAIKGAVHITTVMILFLYRMFFMAAFVIYLLEGSAPGLIGNKIFGSALFIAAIAVFYLVSIEKPPFKRSMAWLALKDRLSVFGRRLAPVPTEG